MDRRSRARTHQQPARTAVTPPSMALAVTSLTGGVIAVLGCSIPLLGLGGVLLGLLASGAGLASLLLGRRGRARGRRLAIAGVVTSSVAVLVAAAVTGAEVVARGGLDGVADSFALGVDEGFLQNRVGLFAGPAAALGVQEPVGDFIVAVTSAETVESTEVDAATGEVRSTVDYVLMGVSIANATGATADPQEDLLFAVMGGDGQVTLGNECHAMAPPAPDAFYDLAPGATVVVPICFDIAPHAVPGSRVGISSARAGEASMELWELQPAR